MQRLGRNHNAYYGETIDIRALLDQFEAAAQFYGWSSEVFLRTDKFKWFALHRKAESRSQQPEARIYISTGIHGDEPAGPLAAMRLVQENNWPASAEIYLLPCLNPNGFVANRRDNGQGIDLNRDYLHLQSGEVRAHIAWLEKQRPFDLCLCLHEDWEEHGFYVYELNPDRRPSLAEAIVAGAAKVCPIDRSEIIEGREARDGIIRPSFDPRAQLQWPEAFWLFMHKTRLSYTLEAPSDFALQIRVDALVHGVNAALARPLLHSSLSD